MVLDCCGRRRCWDGKEGRLTFSASSGGHCLVPADRRKGSFAHLLGELQLGSRMVAIWLSLSSFTSSLELRGGDRFQVYLVVSPLTLYLGA
ncbi:unnamed protein product [Calypogeia fissa]